MFLFYLALFLKAGLISLHNTCKMCVTDQSRLTGIAKVLLKICKQEMSEIENCPDCYLNAHIRKDSWFIEVCVSIEVAMKSVFRNIMQCHIGVCMVCGSFVSPAHIQLKCKW